MELVEGGERGDHGIIFKKVGPELRVVEGGFSSIPSQALAISNNFGLTFFLHSQGFCVAKTHDLVQASQGLVDSEDEYNAMDASLATIHLPAVQSLALSQDELIIAACTENKIHYYNVPALVQEGKEGSQKDTALLKSLSILDEKPGTKVLAWNSVQKEVVLVLSKGGKLTSGPFAEQDLKEVANQVEAADWSPDGQYICYITSDKNLHICKADLSLRSSCELPREMFTDAINDSSEACVDVVKWARVDSILISCVHMDLDGEEDDSKIFVLVSGQGHFAKDYSTVKINFFEGFFTSLDTSILPADSGPFTLSTYVSPWELLVVASRRSIDDHVSLLGWRQEGGIYEVHKYELLDDRFTPRIELQACGDDNSVVGLAVDKTTTSIEIPKPNGDGGEKLGPGPVLFCMTLEGNLSLFSLARTGNNGIDVAVINNLMKLPEANEVLLTHGLPRESSGKKTTKTEDKENKSTLLETLSEEIYKEQSQDTKTQETSNEQIPKTPPAVSVAAGGTTSGWDTKTQETSNEQIPKTPPAVSAGGTTPGPPDRRKEASVENVQAQNVVPVKQKAASLASEMTEQTKSQQPQQTLVQAASSQKLGPLGARKDLIKHGLQTGAGELMKHKEAPVPVEQRSNPLFTAEKKVTSAPALSEMESEFIRELDEVKGMAMQIDNLMALIDGKRKEKGGEAKPFFSKILVEDIESKTRDLFRQCQSFREQLMEQGRSINDLGDEILQVDYGRVYVQSILEQAFDVRYQELWNKQTLHPEVAALRKRILQADQSLKQQIAELEEHLHNLELSQWHKKHHSKHSNVPSARFEDKSFRFMQSLYDTVNTQMVIAQQLAHRLAAQLEVLKLPAIPNEDMENSVDISGLKLQDLVLQEQSGSDLSSKKVSRLNLFRTSDFSPTKAKGSMQTPTKVMAGVGTRAGLQDSTRRRRDSVDKLWVDVGAAKTTVKRAAPRFDEVSFSPKKGMEADNKPLKSRTRSSSAHKSVSGAQSMMTNNSSFNPVQLAERPMQPRTDILGKEVEASVRAEGNRKPQYTDVWKAQPMPQGSTQVTAPSSIVNPVSWPSTALATPPNTATFSASSKGTFSRTSSGRIATQNVSTTNAEKQKALASPPFLSTLSTPQECMPPSQTFPFSRATNMGPSTAKNTTQFTAKPVGTDVAVSKMDPSKKTSFPSASQEKASNTSNPVFPALSLSDSQQKAAMNVLQSKATLVQPQGHLIKSEDPKVGQPVIQPVEMGFAPLTAGRTRAETSGISSAGQQGHTIYDTFKSEAATNDNTFPNTKANASLAEPFNASAVGYATKAVPVFAEQKRSSPFNTVPQEPPAIGPESGSPVQAQSSFAPAATSSPAIEPARQSLGSLSSRLFQSPNAMSTMSTVQGVSTSSEVLSVASGALSQTSSLFNVPSVSPVKPSEFFEKGVIPAEQQSTVNLSTSFMPSTVQEPPVSDEEDMEEVGNTITDFGSSSFAGFGLGSSSSSAGSQHSSPFGATSLWNQSSSPASLSVPAGQLFKPASFSMPTPQSTPQTSLALFGSNLTSGAGGPFANASSGFGSLAQPTPAFGQPAQPGQQALGNALGAFGQTRQIGSPFGVSSSPSGFGGATSGGFASAATGGGFANAATGGGFAGIAGGGGFAGAGSGGGFAGVGSGGGFAGLASGGGFPGGGFAGFSGGSSGSPNPNPSGFGSFSGSFPAFSGNTNSSIFTQMRK